MIVIDSTVWIDLFNGIESPEVLSLHRLFGAGEILVGDLIICKVLQGFRSEREARRTQGLFAKFDQAAMVGVDLATKAARNRHLRGLGITVRRTIDVLIASFCPEHGHLLLHGDRAFEPFVRHFGLIAVPPSWTPE